MPPEDWTYSVQDLGENGVVTIEATTGHIDAGWRMIFDREGRLSSYTWWDETFDAGIELPSVIVDDAPHQVPDVGARPFLPLETATHYKDLAMEWPRFPLEEDYGDDASPLRQRVATVDQGLAITVTAESPHAGEPTKRVMELLWEPRRPWWSSMKIRRTWTRPDGEVQEGLDVDAWVTSWTGA